MIGWIKMDRAIINHWVWKDASYLKAWIALLLSANHEEKKVLIQGELLICKRGQTVMSLSNLAKLFGKEWSIQRVRTFLKLLSDDTMIEVEGLRKTTRVTICKYDSYQSIQQADNKQTTFKQHSNNKQITTTKECKELEEVKESKNKIQYDRVFDFFKKTTSKNIRVFDDKAKSQLKARLSDGYSYEDVEIAIKNCYNDKHHIDSGHKYLTLEFILRPDKLSKFLSMTTSTSNKNVFTPEEQEKYAWETL